MADLYCPYCDEACEVNHDDGAGYAEDVTHEMQCSSCDKYFVFHTSITFHYSPEKADCLNGEPHNMKPVISSAKDMWPDWKRCEDCGHEEKGRFVQPDRMKEPRQSAIGSTNNNNQGE